MRPIIAAVPIRSLRMLGLILVGLNCLSGSLQADSKSRDALVGLVPDDVAFCLIVDNLRENSEKLLTSSWFKGAMQVLESDGRSAGQIKEIEAQLKSQLGITSRQLREDLLGDCVVLAYLPKGMPEDSSPERGIILVKARDGALLARTIDRLNKAQKKSGELKELRAKEYRKHKYFERQEIGKSHYYFVDGPLVCFTTQEALLHQILDRRAKKSEGMSRLGTSLHRLSPNPSFVAFWLNPRALDKEMEKLGASSSEENRLVQKVLAQYWRALDAGALTVDFSQTIQVCLTIQGQTNKLPRAPKNWIQSLAQPSDLWKHFPETAIGTFAVRIDGPNFLKTLEEFQLPKMREEMHTAIRTQLNPLLGRDFFKEALPNLGPDVGVCLFPGKEPDSMPSFLLATRVQPGPGDSPVDQGLFDFVVFWGRLLALDHNRKNGNQMFLRAMRQEGREVRYLEQEKWPAGFRPGVTLKKGYLLIGSSPDAFRQFSSQEKAVKASPILRFSFAELAKAIRQGKAQILQSLEKNGGMGNRDAEIWLEGLSNIGQVFSGLELNQENAPGQITWRLTLQLTSR